MKVTQSLLGTFDDCQLKAQYTIDQPPWHKNIGGSRRAVGTAYHKGVEVLYVARQAGNPQLDLRTMVMEAWRCFEHATKFDDYTQQPLDEFTWDDMVPDQATGEQIVEAMLTEYVEGGHVWPADWEVLAVEERYLLDVGDNVQVSGGADLVLRDPNGWVVGVDNKTAGRAWDQGKHKPRKNTQACLYVALLQEAFPDAPGYRFVFDIMTYPNKAGQCKFERRISDPEQRHIDAAIARAKAFAWTYETVHLKAGLDLPANPGSTLCNQKWCDHWDGCPFGAALD